MIEDYRELVEELTRSGIDREKLHDEIIVTEGNKIVGLDLSDLNLTSIPSSMNRLEELRTLDLSNNSISIIENLDNLGNLTTLNLSGNNISIISGLNSLISLSVLGLANNQIEIISGLDRLHSLRVLNLAGNRIEEIEGLEDLENLKHLDLSKNSIVHMKSLYYPLDVLFLSGNPLSLEVMDKLIHLDNHEFVTWVNNLSVDIEFGSIEMVKYSHLDADEFVEEGHVLDEN
ncbi:MAG: leucine-rich repeat domain-containing protein [Candidatus Hodarchaeales archaeon]